MPQKLGRIDLVIDSSGLGIFGEGEWAAVKQGGKGIRGWKKLHLGDRLHARDADGQSVEARLAGNILNRMTELGMPASYAVRM
ncbi:MAG: hypothetical protein ACI8UD_001959 [Planctomycetota bacterium]|jgi:hypothetical protein